LFPEPVWTLWETVISSPQRPLPDNTHKNHNRKTSMPPVVFELTVSEGERPQTYALEQCF